jgi:hypothetical protein
VLLDTEKCNSEGFVKEASLLSSMLVACSHNLTFQHLDDLCIALNHVEASEKWKSSVQKPHIFKNCGYSAVEFDTALAVSEV